MIDVKFTKPDLQIYTQQFNSTDIPLMPFNKKMMRAMLKGRTEAIIRHCRDDEPIPKKDDLFYIGEPIARTYGWKNKMHMAYSIRYLTDNHTEVLGSGFKKIDITEHVDEHGIHLDEARYFIKIKRCQWRSLGTLKLSRVIHDNIYDLYNTNHVLWITFDVITKDQIQDILHKQKMHFLFED